MAAPELQAPSSGLLLEVAFRRLLASCEEIVAGDTKGRADLADWARSPAFHHYVEALQEQLADLEGSAGGRLDRATHQRYRQHVEALAARLLRPNLPAYCSSAPLAPLAPPPPQQQPANGAPHLSGTQRQQVPRPPAPLPAMPRMPPPPSQGLQPRPAAAPLRISEAATQRVKQQQNLQDSLTDELVGMAAALKSNTLAMEGKVRERGQLLEGTEAALDASLAGTRHAKQRATAAHRRGRVNLCLSCLIVLVICAGFAAMYIFIRVTRMAGYRAHVAAPVAAPPPPSPPPAIPAPATPDPVSYEQHNEL